MPDIQHEHKVQIEKRPVKTVVTFPEKQEHALVKRGSINVVVPQFKNK